MDIAAIPKIELHCHLDGLATRAMVTDLRRADPAFPIHPDDFDGKDVHDYDSFWNWWAVVKPIRALNLFHPILLYHIETLKRQHVRYFELMIGNGDIPKDTAAALEAMHALRQAVDAREAGVIQVEFLVACGRHNTPERFREREDRIIALYEAGLICGVAIAGPEPGHPVRPITRTLARWHETGMGIEVHAGEWVGPESVWDALEYGYPDRIGHGVTLFEDPALVELFQERQIHIEMCPTSNLKTGSIRDMSDHPVRRALDLGLNLGVNTDDPGPFLCTMDSEYALLAEQFAFTAADFATLYANSLDARFQPKLRVET